MLSTEEASDSHLVEASTDLSSREMEVCTLTTFHDGKSLERMERRPSIVIVDYENEEII